MTTARRAFAPPAAPSGENRNARVQALAEKSLLGLRPDHGRGNMDIRAALERVSALLFDSMVLRPILLGERLLGDRVWPPLDRLTGALSRAAGTAFRLAGGSGDGSHALSAAMELVDRSEGWVGVRGGWEIVDDTTVLRKVDACPFLQRLSGRPAFCRRLGLTMGKEALAAAFPGRPIDFEIQGTLSSGDPCCTYRLHLQRAD